MTSSQWSWVCNECGSHEFTSAVSEEDLDWLACTGCGSDEFHKEPLDENGAPQSPNS